MKKLSLFLLLLFLGMGCAPKKESQPVASSCGDLDLLFGRMDRVEQLLIQDPFDSAQTRSLLDSITEGLKANLQSGNTACSFVNQQALPGKVRFQFVDALSRRINSGELPDGLDWMLDWRDMFAADKDIAEYFGEELAWIAKSSPRIYLDWFAAHPEHQEKLFASTRWSVVDRVKTAGAFSALEGGSGLAEKIKGSN